VSGAENALSATASTRASRLRDWGENNSRLILVAGLLLIAAFALLSLRAVQWGAVAQLWSRVGAWWLVLSVAANAGVVAFSTVEWKLLLPARLHVSWKRMWRVNAITALAMNTTPMLAGHGTGVVLLAREPGIGYATAASVLALDQLAEGFAKLTLIALALAVAPGSDWIREGAGAMAIAVGALLILLWALGPRYLRMRPSVIGGRFPAALLAVLAMKGAEGVGVLAAQQALGIQLPPGTLVVVLSATALGTMLPLTPGQVGTYEASAFLAYRWLGLAAEEAMALAVLQHVCYIAGIAGAGYLTLAWTASRDRASSPLSRTPPAPS
jgi:uncharacterized membrane protein YbhN (UPF0104 family)